MYVTNNAVFRTNYNAFRANYDSFRVNYSAQGLHIGHPYTTLTNKCITMEHK